MRKSALTQTILTEIALAEIAEEMAVAKATSTVNSWRPYIDGHTANWLSSQPNVVQLVDAIERATPDEGGDLWSELQDRAWMDRWSTALAEVPVGEVEFLHQFHDGWRVVSLEEVLLEEVWLSSWASHVLRERFPEHVREAKASRRRHADFKAAKAELLGAKFSRPRHQETHPNTWWWEHVVA